jgi:hypothetical protein
LFVSVAAVYSMLVHIRCSFLLFLWSANIGFCLLLVE